MKLIKLDASIKAMAKKNDDDSESDDDETLSPSYLIVNFVEQSFVGRQTCGDFSCTGKLAKAHFSSNHRNIECMDSGQVFNNNKKKASKPPS